MINTQIFRPSNCECKIMLKIDSDFPNNPFYITKEEYLAILESKQGQPEILSMEDAQKQADRIYVCARHENLGHTKTMYKEVMAENLKLGKVLLEIQKIPSMVNNQGEINKKFNFSFNRGELNIYPVDFSLIEIEELKAKGVKING